MNYIDLFRNRIEQEVKKVNGNKEFVDGLFPKISPDIEQAGKLIGLPIVDKVTFANYFETAKKQYLSVNSIDPGISHSLTRKGFETWLTTEREADIAWNYTNRYLKHLLKSGRSPKVIDETSSSSFTILKKIADPKSKEMVYTKGLVVGAVQSGKTGNFNAVINRAIDCGYGLIIVLSGIIEDLRNQTQKRIESDVIGEGKDIENNSTGKKGVGKIERFGPLGNSNINQVKIITSTESDFSRQLLDADFSLNDTNVLVCKKNVSVLRNLIVWLYDYLEDEKDRHNIPLLILDDEADNASLNNLGAKGRNYASRTNSQIRALLALFNRKTYLGYTATPFANVLQDRNDIPDDKYIEKHKVRGESVEKELDRVGNIFPDDFIELLDPPSNYVGAKQIFETVSPIENATDENEKIPLVAPPVNDITDDFPTRVYDSPEGDIVGVKNFANIEEWNENNGISGYQVWDNFSDYRKETRAPRKDDDFPKEIPESLKDAVKCFILTLAIRNSRIPLMENSELFQPHNTMLIHVSRFTSWQNSTKKLIEKYVTGIISRINTDNPSDTKSIYFELEKTWYRHYAHIVENIKSYLPQGYDDEFMVPVVFDSLKNILPVAVKDIEVRAINSSTAEKLIYPKSSPKKIIAIGGNRLSRGFTLEGLTINYFVRATNYSDTLLQMGRWFGYRPGYLDCCKIFTTKDSLDKFNSTTKCIEELEIEFKKMEERGKEPRSFIIRVKKHPGTLKITRPSILKNATEVKWSYQDQLVMTTKFRVKKSHIEKTWNDFRNNIASRFNDQSDALLTFSTSGNGIIKILKTYSNNFDDEIINQVSMFIKLCNDKGLLNDWTVALKVTGNSPFTLKPGDLNINSELIKEEVRLAMRSGPNLSDGDKQSFLKEGVFKASGKNANIISSNTDLAILLNEQQKKQAVDNFYKYKAAELQKKDKTLSKAEAIKNAKKSKTIPERYYREMMTENQGLLIIYLFDSKYAFNQEGKNSKNLDLKKEFETYVKENNIDLDIPLVGFALGFPPIENDPGGEYMKGDYDIEEEEMYEEDYDVLEVLPEDLNDI